MNKVYTFTINSPGALPGSPYQPVYVLGGCRAFDGSGARLPVLDTDLPPVPHHACRCSLTVDTVATVTTPPNAPTGWSVASSGQTYNFTLSNSTPLATVPTVSTGSLTLTLPDPFPATNPMISFTCTYR